MSEPITLILVYDENSDNFFPLEDGTKPDPQKNTHLIIDEASKKITLSFTPNSTLIEKRTIERRVASFIKTGYEVPGTQGLRIGAGLPLDKVDPKENELPDILLTHGHTFGKGKLVRDGIPDYVEKEANYEVEEGSAGTRTDVLGSKVSGKTMVTPKTDPELPEGMKKRLEEAFGKPGSNVEKTTQTKPAATTTTTKSTDKPASPVKQDSLNLPTTDEHLFILGQFVDMYVQKGYQVLVYKNTQGKYEFKTLKEDNKYYIDGNQLYQA